MFNQRLLELERISIRARSYPYAPMIFSKRRGAFKDARERFFETAFFLALRPRLTSPAAFFLADSDVFPLAGVGSFTLLPCLG